MKLKRRYWPPGLPLLLTLWVLAISLSGFVYGLWAAEVDLKPGDPIGPNNWQKVQGMVGENLLNRIKQGYTLKIKETKTIEPLREYNEATEKYSSKVSLGPNGELLNYIAGRPFPNFDRNDSQIGQKVAWNFYWRWLGDDYKNGAALKEGKIIRYFLDRDGSERRGDVINIFIRARNRVTVDPKPVIPGYEHIDWMEIIADEYPRTHPAPRSWRCATPVQLPKTTSTFMFPSFAVFAACRPAKDAQPSRPANLTMTTSIVLTVKSRTSNISFLAKSRC